MDEPSLDELEWMAENDDHPEPSESFSFIEEEDNKDQKDEEISRPATSQSCLIVLDSYNDFSLSL